MDSKTEAATTPLKELLSETLIDAKGNQTKTEQVLSGDHSCSVLGLYFSASWCPPCRGFSPILAQVYEHLNGGSASSTTSSTTKKKFEVILVCSEEKEQAAKYFDHMPWLSIPHEEGELKEKISEHFKIEGIPTLILFDMKSHSQMIITQEGVERVAEHGAEGYPWDDAKMKEQEKLKVEKMSSQTTEQLLATPARNYVINNKGEHTLVSDLAKKDVIGLYFSAHWCPPCRAFTPVLAGIYNDLKAKNTSFEIVFLSSDRDEAGYKSYLDSMPWLSVPFSDPETKKTLSKLYGVQGIPTLVLIEGKTGKLSTLEGRAVVAGFKAEGFPWTEEKLAALKAEEEEKMKKEKKSIQTKGHEHALELQASVYDGNFKCDLCSEFGTGWAYTCRSCGYDLHPECAKKDAA